jgi:hypothetical protein
MAGEVEVPLGDLLKEMAIGSKFVYIKDVLTRDLMSRGASEEEAKRVCLSHGRNLDRKVNQGSWKNKTWETFKSSEEGKVYLAKLVRFQLAAGGEVADVNPGPGFEVILSDIMPDYSLLRSCFSRKFNWNL